MEKQGVHESFSMVPGCGQPKCWEQMWLWKLIYTKGHVIKVLQGASAGHMPMKFVALYLGVCLHFQAQMLFKSCTPYYSHPASHAMVDVQ